ncbi:Clathrin light chain [Coemansia sp. RSA 2673]|nr:Clathrin light chain [Coemansia sp. RSA 2673]KAJ2464947.1 Clathrin light chain [Coemansia sp. RSA 2322]
MSDQYDPTADFLAQERAALGDAADIFQASVSPPPTTSSNQPTPAPESEDVFMASVFDATEDHSHDSPATAFNSLSLQSTTATSPPQPPASEFQQEWQGKQREIVSDRDRASTQKHEDMVKEAQRAVDRFYEEYNEKKDRAIEENRANQEIELQAASSGSLWERVVKQIDLATKAAQDHNQRASPNAARSTPQQQQQQQQQQPQNARDTSRMRELMQDLKRDPGAPGVGGVKTSA